MAPLKLIPDTQRTPSALEPGRALLSPLWLSALAVLVVNDHFLKGSGLLPGFVTGKLSDFAGMLVAPALFATLLRVRDRRTLAGAHIAVGVVFAAIQLSAPFAHTWSTLMGRVGFPWAITMDPTDLLALPVLWVSWVHVTRLMERPAAELVRQSGRLAAAAGGLVACVATSPEEPFDDRPFFEGFFSTAYVHNASDLDIAVTIRELRPEVELDCFDVAADPGGILTDPLFGEATNWVMPARTNVPAWRGLPRDCYAVILDGERLEPTLLFWWDDASGERWVPGQYFEGDFMDPGGVAIALDADGVHTGYTSTGDRIHFPLEPVTAPDGGTCAPVFDGDRVDWTATTSMAGTRTLTGLTEGLDGCLALELATDAQLDQEESGDRFYACMPSSLFPFESGDRLTVGIQTHRVRIEDAADAEPVEHRALELNRAGQLPSVSGVSMFTRDLAGCDAHVEESCGTTSVNLGLVVDGVEQAAQDAPRTVEGSGGATVQIYVAFAERRLALNPECAEGADVLGDDIETVTVIRTPN